MKSKGLSFYSFLLASCFLLPTFSTAQITFERTYGGPSVDVSFSVQPTSDGGYIIAGYTNSFGAGLYDVYLIKTDSLGDTLWTKTYGDTLNDYGLSVEETSDSGFIIVGWTYSFGASGSDIYLIKTDYLGDTLWTKTSGLINNDAGYSVQETQDGGYIITGYITTLIGGSNVYLIKTDSLGNFLWERGYGGPTNDGGYSLRETSDGSYIIVGYTVSSVSGDYDIYLIKTDSLGNSLWTKTYGGTGNEYGYSVQETRDGGYILAGWTYSFGAGFSDVYLIKTNSSGDTLWTKYYGGTGYDEGYSVRKTSDGGYIIAGFTSSFGAGANDVYLIKTDSLGDTLWTRTYGGILADRGYSIQQTSEGGYIISGYTYSFGAGIPNVYLIKTEGGNVHDIGVSSLNAPQDTVLADSTYSVQATIRNFGNMPESFTVFASLDGYSDALSVTNLFPSTDTLITFYPWTVPSVDSAIYTLTVCTQVLFDTFATNNCKEKTILAHESEGPILLTALASDNVNPLPGIDDDDYVLITFHEPTNQASIEAVNIDTVLLLSGGHTWLDGFGTIGGSSWNAGKDRLLIFLSTTFGLPTVSVGDTISPDGVTIQDKWRNPAITPVVITGSFDPVGVEEENSAFSIQYSVFRLFQNEPNPFHSSTLIRYTLPEVWAYGNTPVQGSGIRGGEKMHVKLEVYDITGRLVETLVNRVQESGVYRFVWDGKDEASGIYFYRLKSGNFITTKKLILLK